MNWVQGTLYQSKANMYLQDVRCESSFSVLKTTGTNSLGWPTPFGNHRKSLMENHAHPEIYELLPTPFPSSTAKIAPRQQSTALQTGPGAGHPPLFKTMQPLPPKIETDEAFWHKGKPELSAAKAAPPPTLPNTRPCATANSSFRIHSFKESLQVQLSPQDQSSLECTSSRALHCPPPLPTQKFELDGE